MELPFVIIQSEDLLTTQEPYGFIFFKNFPVAIKHGNIIVLRSDSQEFLDYIIDFLKTLKDRLEPVVDSQKPTRIGFKLYTKNGKVFYIGFGRLNFFEYQYIINTLKSMGILSKSKEDKEKAKILQEDYREFVQWLY
ncbi:hypothetical protein [Caldisericum sp.]|uniref:hypothetical protein n=1 Tax=Caldisericum sp. TaxID=2499687 RepID=UPI003D0E8022